MELKGSARGDQVQLMRKLNVTGTSLPDCDCLPNSLIRYLYQE